MAGRKVPTPHCCIGIFKVNAPEKKLCTYEIHDLLSNTGRSLKPKRESPYARPTWTMMEENRPRNDDGDGGGEVEALAARVAALTVNMKGPKPRTKNHHGDREDAQKRASTGRGANSRKNSGACQDVQKRRSSSRPTELVRRLRGASKSLLSPAGTSRQPTAGRNTAGGPQAGRGNTAVPEVSTRKPPRRSTSKGTAVGIVGQGKDGGAASGGGERRTEPPPRLTPDSGSQKVLAIATKKDGLVSGGPVSAGGGGKDVAPREGSLAGRGFRVAVRRSSRRRAVGGGSTVAGFLGVPVDVLCGSSGVLSFLSPTELCTVRE